MFQLRTQEDLQRDFRETFSRLVRAGEAFDQGHEYEAATIASIIYVMLHDNGKKTPSLLTQLGRKNGMKFLDTAYPLDPKNMAPHMPLVQMQIGGSDRFYIPVKENSSYSATTSYLSWWNKTVLRGMNRHELTRKQLIYFFRHTRGGGHVGSRFEPQEKTPSEAFAGLGTSNAGGWTIVEGEQSYIPLYGVEYATLRQIGWELEQTLRINCSDLIPTPESLRPSFQPIAPAA